ncbi:MAG: response regulator, partial [Spartobacteria bacterium]|nr:response regulator [Spartobacteria bacterium]
MKTLIVDDDFTNRILLQAIMEEYGVAHIAVNGREAVDAVCMAMDDGVPYDLVCLDIMMPEMDGQEALKAIR